MLFRSVAHMFVFYFGLFANITPPVALASFAAAGISGGDPMKTGFQSLKLALAGFIVPFMFVYNPAMLMLDTTDALITSKEFPLPSFWVIASVTITAIVGITALSAAVEGYFKGPLNPLMRIVLAVGAFMLIMPEGRTDILGVVIVGLVVGWNILQTKKANQQSVKNTLL